MQPIKMCNIRLPHDFKDHPCEACHPELKGVNERRGLWLGRATAHFDTPRIRKEAIEKFNKANGLNELYD